MIVLLKNGLIGLAFFAALFLSPFALIQGGYSHAQAGVLEFFFPYLRDGSDDPSRTLQAPFAAENDNVEPVTGDLARQETVSSQDDLSRPHRTSSEVSDWLTMAVSEVLTFESEDYQDDMTRTRYYFDVGGRQLYEAFLTDQKMLKVLESRQYIVRTFVQEEPILLNEGAVDGRYRWLFEVPVMVSYMPKGMHTYEKSDATTQDMLLTLQVGRSPEAPGLGIFVERWAGKLVRTRAAEK